MKTWLVVLVLVLPLSACDGADPVAEAPPAAPSLAVSTAASTVPVAPAPLAVDEVVSRRVPLTIQGLAFYADEAAYVEGEDRLVVMSWRSGERRTVATSRYGSLFMVAGSGRYRWFVDRPPSPAGDDPGSPYRYLRLDLATGQVRRDDYPQHGTLVAQLDDGRFAQLVPGRGADGTESGRVDLQLGERVVSQGGRVVQASAGPDGVVWTQRASGSAEPHELWFVGLDGDQEPRELVDDAETVADPVVGRGFVGWAEDAVRLVLEPLDGGPVTRIPGRIAVATPPAASGGLVAVVVRAGGHGTLEVLRV